MLEEYIDIAKTNDPALIAELRAAASVHSNLYYNAPEGVRLAVYRAFMIQE